MIVGILLWLYVYYVSSNPIVLDTRQFSMFICSSPGIVPEYPWGPFPSRAHLLFWVFLAGAGYLRLGDVLPYDDRDC
jgi:hypothetical protein